MTQFAIVPPVAELLIQASVASLRTNVQLRTEAALTFLIPPPRSALFPVNMQLTTVGLLPELFHIPPPPSPVVFVSNVQLVTVGLLLEKLYIPPPL